MAGRSRWRATGFFIVALTVAGASPTAPVPGNAGAAVPDPVGVAAQDGVLTLTLTAKPATVEVGGKSFDTNVYNGMYIPPVIRLKRGEELRLTLVNEIEKAETQCRRETGEQPALSRHGHPAGAAG